MSRPVGRPPKPSEALARDTLLLLKRRSEPEAAVAVLQEAGLLKRHEPVPVLRLGHNAEGDFTPKLQSAAQVGLLSTCLRASLSLSGVQQSQDTYVESTFISPV